MMEFACKTESVLPWTLMALLSSIPCLLGATVEFKESRFEFTPSKSPGIEVNFDCPADKWCGIIISEGFVPQVFKVGDAYVMARHGICQRGCCESLKNNDYPDHSCPHPNCCTHNGPIGLRSFRSVMGDGWSWDKNKGIGCVGGLRGDASYKPVNESSASTFTSASVVDGRNLAHLTLPFGRQPPAGFIKLDSEMRAVSFAQASVGAMSFDGLTSIDLGYHGKGAFTSCLINGTHICGCGWPFYAWASQSSWNCVEMVCKSSVIKGTEISEACKPAPQAQATATPNDQQSSIVGYDLMSRINNKLELHWRIDSEGHQATYLLHSKLSGWLALGWGTEMTGSTAVIGNLLGDSKPQLYKLNGRNASSVNKINSSCISNVLLEAKDDGIWLRFSQAVPQGTTDLIAAASGSSAKAYHQTMAKFQLDLNTGTQTPSQALSVPVISSAAIHPDGSISGPITFAIVVLTMVG